MQGIYPGTAPASTTIFGSVREFSHAVVFYAVSIPRASYASRQLRRTVSVWAAAAAGLSAAASAGVPRVIWADQNLPRPALPYISLRRVSAETIGHQARAEADVPTTTRVVVTTTTAGAAARVILGFGSAYYIVQAGDTLTSVRDGLIAAILARPDAVTCTTVAADSFDIAGLGIGLAWPIEAIEGVTTTPTASADIEIVDTTFTTLVRVEIFGADSGDEQAQDYSAALIADLYSASTVLYFASAGCSIVGRRPSAVNLSAMSGALQETREYFDVSISQLSRSTDDASALASAGAGSITLLKP